MSVAPVSGATAPSGLMGGLFKLAAMPFQVVSGGIYGTAQASLNSAPVGLYADVAERSLFQRIANWFDDFVGKGIVDINNSGIADDAARIGQKGAIGDILGKLFSPAQASGTAAAGVGGRGLALIGARAVAGAGLAAFGFNIMTSSFWKLSQGQKGYTTFDYHRNPWLHGAEALGGAGMFVGGIIAIPGVAAGLGVAGAFGLPLALAGLALYGVARGVSKIRYEPGIFTNPKDHLWWPFYLPFERSAIDAEYMGMTRSRVV